MSIFSSILTCVWVYRMGGQSLAKADTSIRNLVKVETAPKIVSWPQRRPVTGRGGRRACRAASRTEFDVGDSPAVAPRRASSSPAWRAPPSNPPCAAWAIEAAAAVVTTTCNPRGLRRLYFENATGWSSSAAALALRDASVPRAAVTFVLPATARPGAAARPTTVNRANGHSAAQFARQHF